MSIIFMSSKGGNCTTVTAAALAAVWAKRGVNTLLIDLCGDVPAAIGMAEPSGPGINDWLGESQTADPQSLVMSGAPVVNGLVVVHRGSRFVAGQPRWSDLAAAISSLPHTVIIDAGTTFIPDELRQSVASVALVTKPCYLSLRRATQLPPPTEVFLIDEDNRALTASDVSSVLGVPIAAKVPHSAAIARAVDAGLLLSRADDLFGRHLPEHPSSGQCWDPSRNI